MSITEAYLNRFYEDLMRDQIDLLRTLSSKPDKDITRHVKLLTELMTLVIKLRDFRQKITFL